MHETMLASVLRRLNKLERESARLRVGEVTGVGPLDVALGGASTSYQDVAATGSARTGDQVAALVSGNDLLVLGRVGDGGTPWTTVTYATNWRRLQDQPAEEVQVLRTPDGTVHLRGIIERTAAVFTFPSTICTIPSGFRPASFGPFGYHHIWSASQDSVAAKSILRCWIEPTTGVVTVDQSTGTHDGGIGSYIYLYHSWSTIAP